MAKHRRYPVKQTKKAKSTDPYARMSKDSNKKLKNCVPKKEDLDDQKFTRKWLDIQEASKEAAKLRTRTGKKRSKNKFYEMTAKMGFQKRPWENEQMLANRIVRAKNRSIDDELIKVQTGNAGRNPKELEAELKQLDEKDRRKKLLKIAAREKQKKIREKEERFRESRLAQHADDFELNGSFMDASGAEDDSEDDQQMEEDESDVEQEQIQSQVVRKSTSTNNQPKTKSVQKQEPIEERKKRLSSSEKARLKKKTANQDSRKHLMLNAREIIPFGERVDAPPKFTSGLRKTLDPLFAQAGKKDLLLKNLIKSDNKSLYGGQKAEENSNSTDGKITELDRLRAIEAYRELKRNKK